METKIKIIIDKNMSNDLSDNNIAKRKMLKAIYTGIFKTSKSYFILKFN